MIIARGVRDAEERLIQEVLRLDSQRGGEFAALAQPIRIVVPSSSLRKHLSASLVRRAGHSLLGVRLHTLRGVAQSILEAAGEDSNKSDFLFSLLCRQEVAKEPALRVALEELEDGFGAVVGTLSDLLDAGLESPMGDALLESLEELSPSSTQAKSTVLLRAQELVRVAARLGPALNALGGERTGDLYRRAADCYSRDPESCLPASSLFIFGFADVTGVAGDLLERLLTYGNTKLLLDLPPDPAHPQALDAGAIFADRFAQRFGAFPNESKPLSESGEETDTPLPAPGLHCFQAPGSRAEVEEVASRIRGLLDSGVSAESVGVVIRQVGPYASDIRAVFLEQGIPYSAPGESGVMAAPGRWLSCLRQVLRHGERVAVEPWLDVLVSLSTGTQREEKREEKREEQREEPLTASQRELLRVAAHEAGAARLINLSELSSHGVGRPRFSRGMGLHRQEKEDGVLWQSLSERPGAEEWKAFLRQAQKCVDLWSSWPQDASWEDHCAALARFLTEGLGWQEENDSPCLDLLRARFLALEGVAPKDWQLTRGEARSLFAQALLEVEEELRADLGGEGAGVQVHSVTDARSISFAHLYLLGLNRNQFPRSIREDSLLPDWLRQHMAQLLPELPLKLKAADEEKFLFAQLLSASSQVTLSWQCVDNAGKELALSPLVMRLQIEGVLPEVADSSAVDPVERWRGGSAQGSSEVALRYAALTGTREDFQQLLPTALQAVQHEMGSDEDIATLAAARFEVLEEIDLDLRGERGQSRQSQAGPYFGFLGGLRAEDPRNNPLYVTTLESFAKCPWQSLLEKTLKVAPPPDALAGIPVLDHLLLGNMVHQVLERIVQRSLPAADSLADTRVTLKELEGAEAVSVTWPKEQALEKILADVVRKSAFQMGVPGWDGLLLRRLRPLVERAKALDWEEGARAVSCLGIEATGEILFRDAKGRDRPLFFRADRVDRVEHDGESPSLCLVDYKSGKNFVTKKKEAKRAEELITAIASGVKMQGAVYALSKPDLTGMYKFLSAATPLEEANLVLRRDEEIERALRSAVSILWEGMEKGAYLPRLLDGKGRGSKLCDYCAVSQACVKGDSSFRQRLLALLGALSGTDLDNTPALESFESLWSMSTGDPHASSIPEDRWLSIEHENQGASK